MKKKTSLQSLLFEQQLLGILVFTLLVLFVWIGASVYFTYNTSTLTSDETIIVTPLNPIINTKPLDAIRSRKWWTSKELQSFPINTKVESNESDQQSSSILPSPPLVTTPPTASPSSTAVPSPTPPLVTISQP